MINYYKIDPPISLAPFVRFYWVLECNVCPSSGFVYRHMADGCAELIFHYQGRFDEIRAGHKTEKSFMAGIHAQNSGARRFKIDRDFGIFGVYLYPYAIPALLNIPANELSNSMFDLQTLLGKEGKKLEEKMMEARNNDERIQIVTGSLMARLSKSKYSRQPLYSSINSIIQSNGQINCHEMAGKYGLSIRQFERKFKEFSGFSPKLFSRIIRFRSVFDEFKNGQLQLTEIAYKCGYYDQSHFIHDFKEFSGYSPKEVLYGSSADTTIYD